VKLELNLKYNEPWGQMQPVRHALGALLLEQGRVDEALAEFQEDVSLWRNNMWGLLGLKQCLEKKIKQTAGQGHDTDKLSAELLQVQAQFLEASDRADKVPTATCFCATSASPKSACCSEFTCKLEN